MDDHFADILYYPNFNQSALPSIKQSLLLYNTVNLIAPLSTPILGSALADSSGMELSDIKQKGAIKESWGLLSHQKLINIIPDKQIIEAHRGEFIEALCEDLKDQQILAWESQLRIKLGGKSLSWFVKPQYFDEKPPLIDNPDYAIEPFESENYGKLLRLPFLVGMSIGLSEALWAAVDGGYTLFTDDITSQQFLMFRLQRGWKHLSDDEDLRHEFGLEQAFAQQYATASIGSWILKQKIPTLIDKTKDMEIEQILKLRERSNLQDALEAYRAGLAKLVKSSDMWEASSYKEFENRAFRIFQQSIQPAFEELEEKRILSIRDVFSAADWKDAVKETIKASPKLLMGAAVPAAAGSAVMFGSVAVAPAALLALSCGLTANYVKNLLDNMGDRLKNRRSAQFLQYPLKLRDALN